MLLKSLLESCKDNGVSYDSDFEYAILLESNILKSSSLEEFDLAKEKLLENLSKVKKAKNEDFFFFDPKLKKSVSFQDWLLNTFTLTVALFWLSSKYFLPYFNPDSFFFIFFFDLFLLLPLVILITLRDSFFIINKPRLLNVRRFFLVLKGLGNHWGAWIVLVLLISTMQFGYFNPEKDPEYILANCKTDKLNFNTKMRKDFLENFSNNSKDQVLQVSEGMGATYVSKE